MARLRRGRLRWVIAAGVLIALVAAAADNRRTSHAAAPDPDGQALIYGAKVAPPSGGVQGGDFRALLT